MTRRWSLLISLVILTGATLSSRSARAEPEAPAASVFVRDTERPFIVENGSKIVTPPGDPPPDDAPDEPSKGSWRLKNGRIVTFLLSYWMWEQEKTPEGKTRWFVELDVHTEKPNGGFKLRADTLSPSEEPRLVRLLWQRHRSSRKSLSERREKETAYQQEALKWADRIAVYSGLEPPTPGELALPSLSDPAIAKAPDVRALWAWRLNSMKGIQRDVGRFLIVDWAAEETPNHVFGPRFAIPVKIRFEDGTEETVPAGCIRGANDHLMLMRSLWNDWRKLVAAGGEIPGRELKLKALMVLLAEHWRATEHMRADEKAKVAATDAKDARERARPYRWGTTLSFPGLPPDGFRTVEDAGLDRSLIPVVDQGPLGSRASDCLPSSIATFFLWWDEQKRVPLQQKGDALKKADWLHSQLAREMRTLNNRGTQWGNVVKGLTDFSNRHLDGRYAFQLNYDYDYSPGNVARYVQGGHATVLNVTLWNGQRESGGHAVPVLEATSDGRITIATWGMKLSGTWRETELRKASKPRAGQMKVLPAYELDLSGISAENKKELRSYRFCLDHTNMDGIAVITPFVRIGARPDDGGPKR